LAFAIIDAVIDHYFPIVNDLGSRVDAIEEDVVDTRTPPDMYAIRDTKHDLAKVRQAIWPMRDALTAMMTMESWFDLEHRLFLRNALDHVMRLIDMLDAIARWRLNKWNSQSPSPMPKSARSLKFSR